MPRIHRRKYKSFSKKIRVAADRLYEIIGRIKHAYDLSDDDLQYTKMKEDLMKVAIESQDISHKAEDFLQTTELRNY